MRGGDERARTGHAPDELDSLPLIEGVIGEGMGEGVIGDASRD